MLRSFASKIAFSAAVVASLASFGRNASACSLPAPGWYLFDNVGQVPLNGVLVLHYACYNDCDVLPDPQSFTLADAAGEPVSGEVVLTGEGESSRYLVFRPEPGALTAGASYTATLEGALALEGVVADPELTWSDSITPTDELFEIDYPAGDTVTCTGPIDTCGGLPGFRTMVDRKTAVSVTWGDESKPDTTAQYAYRIIRTGGVDLPLPWRWNGGSAGFELDETEASACYVLELQKLTDGSVQTFDERCVERPAEFEPGVQPVPEETIYAVLESCDGPPQGYQDEWCKARGALCDGTGNPGCDNYAPICIDDDGDAGAAGWAGSSSGGSGAQGGSGARGGTTGSGGSGGTQPGVGGTTGGGGSSGGSGGTQPGAGGSADAGAPDLGDAGDDGSGDGERIYTKGCGCALPGNGTNQPAALALTALGLAALVRRRRQRA